MVGLLVTLTPIEIRKLQKKLLLEERRVNGRMKKEINKSPIERNKFQID